MAKFKIIPTDVRNDYSLLKNDSERITYLTIWRKICSKAKTNFFIMLEGYREFRDLKTWIDREIEKLRLNLIEQKIEFSDPFPEGVNSFLKSKSEIPKIKWNFSEDSLIEFFDDLINFGYINNIERYQIFEHFEINKNINKKLKNYNGKFSKIIWLKSPTLFVKFIITLISKNAITIPNYRKFKIFCNHFLNDQNEEFDPKYLAKYASQIKTSKTNPHEELVDLINNLK